jgi:hypothetical protein
MQIITDDLETALAASGVYPKSKIIMYLSNNRVYEPVVTCDNDVRKNRIVDGVYDPSMKFAVTDSNYYRTDDWARTWPTDELDNRVPWSSDTESDSGGDFSPPLEIEVTYPEPVTCNKILLTSDIFVSMITSVTIDIKIGGSYYNAVTNYDPGDYKTDIYLQTANGLTWSDIVNRTYTTEINAIRVKVNSISIPGRAQIYEIDAAIEVDVSDDVISWSVRKERDLSSTTVNPIGISSANSASISLDNSEDKYNNEYETGPYFSLLLQNTKFDIYSGFKLADTTYEYMKQGEFYVDTWSMSDNTATMEVSLRDMSKILQETEIPQMLYDKWLISDIVRDIAEKAGILKFIIDTSTLNYNDLAEHDRATIVNIDELVCVPGHNLIWTTEGQTFWDFLQQIAVIDLGVYYFDENGYFNFKIKESLTDPAYPDMVPVKTLMEDNEIQTAQWSTELLKNDFSLEYIIPELSETVALWEADDPTVLRATNTTEVVDTTETSILVVDSEDWPDEGYFKINSEIIKYSDNDRDNNRLHNCERGKLNTNPASHDPTTIVYEIREFDIDYTVGPAKNITYILTNEAYAEVISFDFSPASAKIYVLNNYNGTIIIEGAQIKKAIENLPEFFIIIGKAFKQDSTSDTKKKQNDDSIRKYGRQKLELNLQWVQSKKHAQQLLDYLIAVYSSPIIFVNANTFAVPHLQLGDMVIIDYGRLGLRNRNFHITAINLGMDSSNFTQSLTLRSKAGEQEIYEILGRAAT